MAEEDRQQPTAPCTACRGTGSVVSHLGGTPQTVTCPWCEGSGSYVKGHDAQEHWREQTA
jgi:DnaJ-class molecular chaperone